MSSKVESSREAEETSIVEVKVPDIGDFDSVDVIETLVSVGDTVAVDDSLVTLESDKASMEVPSPVAGVVEVLSVSEGDQVAEGSILLTVKVSAKGAAAPESGADEESGGAGLGGTASALKTPQPTEIIDEGSEHYDYDLVVLGSGPGGYAAAFRAADLGLRVCLIERNKTLGGVCLNVGCIPSKALLHAAKVIAEAEAFAEHGVSFGKPEIDLDRLRSWKESVVAKLTGGLEGLAKRRKVTVLRGHGSLQSSHEILVESAGHEQTGKQSETQVKKRGKKRSKKSSKKTGPLASTQSVVSFDKLVLAVGSRVTEIPGIPYASERVWDSTAALELREIPDRLLVIGGGIIGLEMATVYAALGSAVSVVELLPTIMTGADRDLVRPLQRRIETLYENIWTETKVIKVTDAGNELVAHLEGDKAPESATFDAVLVAVGRRPNGDQISADRAGVEVSERGFIAVDDQQRTNVPNIFAIGDLVGQPMLAHKATHEGHVAAEVAAGLKSGFDARVIPSVAYTDPEVAWVGLTELEAKDKDIAYEKGVFPWAASGRALALGRSEGSTKLLFDPETHRLLGGGVVGPGAGDVIAEIGHAVEMNSDAQDLALTVHAHPTLAETVGLAAEVFEGTVTDIYAPKKRKKPKK